MTGYPIDKIIDWGVCLLDWPYSDWDYDTQFDIILVREGSKLYTWLALLNR
jgi:hypothetical protein